MKQHITIEQLNELSKKGKEKLHDWWKNKSKSMRMYDRYKYAGPPTRYEDVESNVEYWSEKKEDPAYPVFISLDGVPLLSIGQMIEFLIESEEYFSNDTAMVNFGLNFTGKTWNTYYGDGEDNALGDSNLELCDALWEAVKEVLDN